MREAKNTWPRCANYLLLFGNLNTLPKHPNTEILETMKWATPDYIAILSTFNDRHQAADQDQREDIVIEAKQAIKAAANGKGVEAPAGLAQVTPI